MRYLSKPILALLLMLVALQPAIAAQPSFTVLSPKDGDVINGSKVTIDLQTSNFTLVPSTVPLAEAGKHPELNKSGEGHYHLALDLRPLVILDHTGSYTYDNVAPGEHQLMIELVNIDHSSFSPPIMQQIKFTTKGAEALPQTGVALSSNTAVWLALLGLSLMMTASGWLVLRRKRVEL